MTGAIGTFFLAGCAAYVLGAVLALLGARRGVRPLLHAALGLAGAGAALFAVVLLLRWTHWGLLPLSTVVDALCLFTILSTAIAAATVATNRAPGLVPFYLPPLGVVCVATAALARDYLAAAPRELRGAPLAAHVGLAFLAYALFYIASATSLAYVFQNRRLKAHNTRGIFRELPSLERLDTTLVRLIALGYPLFAVTLGVGLIWAWFDHQLLTPQWWFAPKVMLSVVSLTICAVAFHLRHSNRLLGVRLAWFVFVGFLVLLFVDLMLVLTDLNTHNFWEGGV